MGLLSEVDYSVSIWVVPLEDSEVSGRHCEEVHRGRSGGKDAYPACVDIHKV